MHWDNMNIFFSLNQRAFLFSLFSSLASWLILKPGLSSNFDECGILNWWNDLCLRGFGKEKSIKKFLRGYFLFDPVLILLFLKTIFQGQGVTSMNAISSLVAAAGILFTIISYRYQHKYCQAPSLEGTCAISRVLYSVSGLTLYNESVSSHLNPVHDALIHRFWLQ